jgi:NAD(P)-dependent dehydrogenase (short-subunit alcohol dehydrogenase family)
MPVKQQPCLFSETRMTTSPSPLNVFRLDGKIAAITGGSRGIGRATAELFIAAGARVIIMDRDQASAEATAKEIGATAITVDVADEHAVTAAFKQVEAQFERLDILINNAGCAIRRPTADLTLADWQRVIDVNMTGVFLCAQAAGRMMLRQQSGTIVNMASIFGFSGGGVYPNISYQTSKGAVVNMTRALAVEWAASNIRVNALAPTWVDTDFITLLKENPAAMEKIHQTTPMGRLAKTEEVANACLFLASPAASMITGHTLPVDGGFLAQ